MGDEGEYWREHREYVREQNQRTRARAYTKLEELEMRGYFVQELTPYHFRINFDLDVFPTNQKFHDLRNNERGFYDNLIKFVTQRLK